MTRARRAQFPKKVVDTINLKEMKPTPPKEMKKKIY
jgi:hypothetical protein